MKIKLFIIFIFLSNLITINANQIPQPKNDMLYTEFTLYRTASYLKKPAVSTGYIVMNGKNNFLFKQQKPVIIEIRKKNDLLTYKKGKMEPIVIDKYSNEIFILFTDPIELNKDFNVKKEKKGNKTKFIITPKEKNKITQLIIFSMEDKIEIMEITFQNNNKLKYVFTNTATGVEPDDKYFKE